MINVHSLVNRAVLPYPLINARTMCPALILAASRNDRVTGRTLILIVSIITRKGFSQSGAPPGKRLAIHFLVSNTIPEIIRDIHRGRPNLNVKIRCLENPNTAGSSPIRLIIIIIRNSLTKKWFIPLIWTLDVRFPCSFIMFIKEKRVVITGLGVVHSVPVNITILSIVNIQKDTGDTEL